MKTKQHMIKGASLERIESLSHFGTPDWVPYTVTASSHPSALEEAMTDTRHFSGLLRECSRSDFVEDGVRLVDEAGGLHNLEELLDDAAERLDQAHQEWLEQREFLDTINKASNTLDIEVRNVYGIDRFYPANDKARQMAEMLYGRKTLNQDDLNTLAKDFHFQIRLTNAVAHNWLPGATSKLAVTS